MKRFSVNDSFSIKGIAIIFMIIHHCFRTGAVLSFGTHNIFCDPLKKYQVVNIADFGKLCVPIFAFLSGYGLYLSYIKAENKRSWTITHLIKTLSVFWIIVILQWSYYLLTSNRISSFYFKDGIPSGIIHMITEFFGIASILGFKTLDGGWWYMGTAVFFIIIIPFIYCLIKKSGAFSIFCFACLIPYVLKLGFMGNNPISFFPIFCLGILFVETCAFDKIDDTFQKIKQQSLFLYIGSFLVSLLIVLLSYKTYTILEIKTFWLIKYSLIPLIIIIFAFQFIIKIPYLNNILFFLGKHSFNIYLTHLFFRSQFNDFIYSVHNWILISALLLAVSLITSIIIENVKHFIHYDILIKKITAFWNATSSIEVQH